MQTWAEVQKGVRASEEDALRAALESSAWTLLGAARALQMGRSSLQAVLRRHPKLAAEIPGRRALCEAAARRSGANAATR